MKSASHALAISRTSRVALAALALASFLTPASVVAEAPPARGVILEQNPGGEVMDPAFEVLSERTQFRKIFRAQDDPNERIAAISAAPLHWERSEGEWADIDTDFTRESNGALAVRENAFQTVVRPTLSGGAMVDVIHKGHRLRLARDVELFLRTASGKRLDVVERFDGAEARTEQNRVEFSSGLGGHLIFDVGRLQVEEKLLLPSIPFDLDEAPGAELVFREVVELSRGLSVQVDGKPLRSGSSGEGLIVTLHEGAETRFRMALPAAFESDAKGAPAGPDDVHQGRYRARLSGRKLVLEKVFPAEWFAQEDRQYPVVLDPTVEPTYVIQEADYRTGMVYKCTGCAGGEYERIYSYGAADYTAFGDRLRLYSNGSTRQSKAWLAFDIDRLPRNITSVSWVRLHVYLDQVPYRETNATIEFRDVNLNMCSYDGDKSWGPTIYNAINTGTRFNTSAVFSWAAPAWHRVDLGGQAPTILKNNRAAGLGYFNVGMEVLPEAGLNDMRFQDRQHLYPPMLQVRFSYPYDQTPPPISTTVRVNNSAWHSGTVYKCTGCAGGEYERVYSYGAEFYAKETGSRLRLRTNGVSRIMKDWIRFDISQLHRHILQVLRVRLEIFMDYASVNCSPTVRFNDINLDVCQYDGKPNGQTVFSAIDRGSNFNTSTMGDWNTPQWHRVDLCGQAPTIVKNNRAALLGYFNVGMELTQDTCTSDVRFHDRQHTKYPRVLIEYTVECTHSGHCNDGIPCTDDICDSGRCVNTISANQCYISGGCYNRGYRSGQCRICDPSYSQTSWKTATGSSCSDGNSCTKNDTCRADGACVGQAYTCNDGLWCTTDSCNGTGGCNFNVRSDKCLISGRCYNDRDINPSAPCQECRPTWGSYYRTHWGYDNGNSCNDGNACTYNDRCSAGRCVGDGYSCDDGKACTIDVCLGNGSCTHNVRSDACLIGSTCYSNGQEQPGNPCRECRSAVSRTSWSNVANGTKPRSCWPCSSGSSSRGICHTGTQTCRSGVYGPCSGHQCPVAETCNGQDDDCDGSYDEGNPGGGAVCNALLPGTRCDDGRTMCRDSKLQCYPNVSSFGSPGAANVPSGLLSRSYGTVGTDYKLVTSNGRFMYNLAYSSNGVPYSGWRVRKFELDAAGSTWNLIDDWSNSSSSFYTDGIVATNRYLYAIEWNNSTARVARFDTVTKAYVPVHGWVDQRATEHLISGQWDWSSNRVWLGRLYNGAGAVAYWNISGDDWRPSVSNENGFFECPGIPNSGVVSSDGSHLYMMSWGGYGPDRYLRRCGTGLNGTTRGRDYGRVATWQLSNTLTGFYHSDGYFYVGGSGSPYSMQRVRVTKASREVCDNVDNNCSGGNDEFCDLDNDNHCDSTLQSFGTPSTCTGGTADCNDWDATINPGHHEECDAIDHDCDSFPTEDDAERCVPFWEDVDDDWYGAYSVLDEGPTGFWTMDAAFGSEVFDSSGRDHDGVRRGNIALSAGYIGDALDARGNGSQYLEIPHHAELQPTNRMSVEAWVYVRNGNGSSGTIVHKGGSSTSDIAFMLRCEGNVIKPYTSVNGALYHQSGYAVSRNAWHHVAWTWDGRYSRLYVDGVHRTTRTTALANMTTTSRSLYIGRGYQSSTAFNGLIDEVAYFRGVLTPDEIEKHYAITEHKVRCLCDPEGDFDTIWGGDCGDTAPAINPDASETCDGVDQNCNFSIDEGTDGQCNDGLSCTSDYCGGGACRNDTVAGTCLIGGTCYTDGAELGDCHECEPGASNSGWTYMTGKACADGNACTHTDVCQAGGGGCGGTAYSCNDGLACTTDVCLGDGRCSNTINSGWCVIGGACVASGSVSPSNSCQWCNPAASTTAYTNRPSGATCTADAYSCTYDRCDGAGTCTHPIRPANCLIGGRCYNSSQNNPANECQYCVPSTRQTGWTNKAATAACTADAYGCTTDRCNGAGACIHPINGGWCLIGGTCMTDGTANGMCRECEPARSQTQWSYMVGKACNDSESCTHTDLCTSGSFGDDRDCRGTAYSCDDGLSCTADVCLGDGNCTNDIVAGRCLIDGVCYLHHETSPNNECLWCDAGRTNTAWSNKPNGTACTDEGLDCTADYCTAGSCTHNIVTGRCLIGGVCYTRSDRNPAVNCEHCWDATSKTAWVDVPAGQTCTADAYSCTTDQCDGAGTCTHPIQSDKCLISSTCYTNLQTNPGAECEWCDPSRTHTAWTDKPTSQACSSDGLICTSDYCNGSGTCAHTLDSGYCLIGNRCYTQHSTRPGVECEWCETAQRTDRWSDKPNGMACSADAYACTLDQCDGAGTCGHPIRTGWCLIDSKCYADGAPNGMCRECEPTASQTQWSYMTNKVCNDGEDCTHSDKCLAGGVDDSGCEGVEYSCDDALTCTADQCLGDGNCRNRLINGWCLIGGVCYANHAPNPANECQWCDPASSTSGWTHKPSGMVCTGDVYTCTDDVCDGGGACVHPIQSDRCLIDSVCYATTQDKPDNPCQECTPGLTQTAWSHVPPNTVSQQCYPCGVSAPGIGECDWGIQWCESGTWGACADYVCPVVEDCDLKDNDCDSLTDEEEDLGYTTCGLGECRHTIDNCVDGVDQVCDPMEGAEPETCDSLDNDCNGRTDEVFSIIDWDGSTKYIGEDCGTGACTGGTVVCSADGLGAQCSTWSNMSTETCDGTDEDCDGTVDDNTDHLCADAYGCTTDVCHDGACLNTIDDGTCLIDTVCYVDHDQRPGVPCQECASPLSKVTWSDVPPNTRSQPCWPCSTGGDPTLGECRWGTQWCEDGGWGSCGGFVCAADDVCDLKDNDCDGSTDENIPDDGIACTTDECIDGVEHHPVNAGWCLIDGTGCYEQGDINPSNGCEVCYPSVADRAWSDTLLAAGFETGLEGFTVADLSASSVVWQPDGARAFSGAQSLYFGRPATHLYEMGSMRVRATATSPWMTLPNAIVNRLSFMLYLATEEFTASADYDVLRVYVEDEGGAKIELWNSWQALGGTTFDVFERINVDLSAYAGLTVRLVFDFDSGDDSLNDHEGAYVDDILVETACCAVASDCDDQVACTTESCVGGLCQYADGCSTCIPTMGNVVLNVDRSVSMAEAPTPGPTDKWSILTQAMTDVLPAYDDLLDLALNAYPTSGDCAHPYGLETFFHSTGEEISDYLVGTNPLYDDAMSRSLAEARAIFASSAFTGHNFVVLLTDGSEECGGDPAAAAEALAADGVSTYVLGFGDGVDHALLDSVAVAGGRPLPKSTVSDRTYRYAEDLSGLSDALESILQTAHGEQCDNVDNDCDGLIDNDVPPVGCNFACRGGLGGTQTCVGGAWSECSVVPVAEVCNGIDDDCDGLTDADDPDLLDNDWPDCEVQIGVCQGAQKPASLCQDGAWLPCGAPEYMGHHTAYVTDEGVCGAAICCDGLDNDCDGLQDEDMGQTTCGLGLCEHTVDNCVNGEYNACDPFEGAVPEICDGYEAAPNVFVGIDNDCDGEINEQADACDWFGPAGEPPADWVWDWHDRWLNQGCVNDLPLGDYPLEPGQLVPCMCAYSQGFGIWDCVGF